MHKVRLKFDLIVKEYVKFFGDVATWKILS